MEKHRTIIISMLVILLLLVVVGCNNKQESKNTGELAYISVNQNSQYEKTFKDLQLGFLLDYNLRLPNADNSWVTIWVEGYQNGEKMEPFHLAELSYGASPNHVEEGPMGVGFINPTKDNTSVFLYTSVASTPPEDINNILNRKGVGLTSWGYAIGNEELALVSGEPKVLGVYREVKYALKSYDFQDSIQLNQMIKDDMTVLLLKIKVEAETQP